MIQQFLRVVFCAWQKCSGYMVGVILRPLSRPRGIVSLSSHSTLPCTQNMKTWFIKQLWAVMKAASQKTVDILFVVIVIRFSKYKYTQHATDGNICLKSKLFRELSSDHQICTSLKQQKHGFLPVSASLRGHPAPATTRIRAASCVH